MSENSEKVDRSEKPPLETSTGMNQQEAENQERQQHGNRKQCYYPQVVSYLWGGRGNNPDRNECDSRNDTDTGGFYTYSRRNYGGGGSSSVTRVVLWVVTLSIVGLLGQRVYNLEQRLSHVEGQLLLILTHTSVDASSGMRYADSSNIFFDTNQNTNSNQRNNDNTDKVGRFSSNLNGNSNFRLVRGVGLSEFISEDGSSVGHPMLRFRREANPQHNSKEDQDLIDNVILGGNANSASGGGGGGAGGVSVDMSHCPCTQGMI